MEDGPAAVFRLGRYFLMTTAARLGIASWQAIAAVVKSRPLLSRTFQRTTMASQIDSYRSAKILISRYGAGAEAEAREKLESLASKGALERTATGWRLLAAESGRAPCRERVCQYV